MLHFLELKKNTFRTNSSDVRRNNGSDYRLEIRLTTVTMICTHPGPDKVARHVRFQIVIQEKLLSPE